MVEPIQQLVDFLRGFGFSNLVIVAIVITYLLYRIGYIDRLMAVWPWLGAVFSARSQARIESAQDIREHTQRLEERILKHTQKRQGAAQDNEVYLMQALAESNIAKDEFIQEVATTSLNRVEQNQLNMMQNQLHIIRILAAIEQAPHKPT